MERWLRAARSGMLVAIVLVVVFAGVEAIADPCLVVYPASPCEYHYDPGEYYTVGFGDSLYDPAFDRGGEVLIDLLTGEIALDVYQAPVIYALRHGFRKPGLLHDRYQL